MVCYAGKQEKPFWFTSLGEMVQFGAIIFCRTYKNYFGQFVWIEKKKRHYNSRVSLHEAPTKKLHFTGDILEAKECQCARHHGTLADFDFLVEKYGKLKVTLLIMFSGTIATWVCLLHSISRLMPNGDFIKDDRWSYLNPIISNTVMKN